jgi:hypothetical protein
MISEAAQKRQDAYDSVVAALHRVNPKAVPIARPGDVFAIPLVAQQVRETAPPAEPKPSPERMLHSRVSNMEGAVSELVARAKRKGIQTEVPVIKETDLGARLQKFIAFHDDLERTVAYFDATTKEQRAIDSLGHRVIKLEKRMEELEPRMEDIAAALAKVAKLLPLFVMKDDSDAR